MTLTDICNKAQEIPASPAILPVCLKLLDDEDASLQQLSDVVKQDIGLSASVLKLANSAAFGGEVSFDSLDDAIFRLVFSLTYNLVVTAAGGRWNNISVEGYSWTPGDFFRHSLTVAVSAQKIAKALEICDADLAYTAGLMHESGKLALAYACPAAINQARVIVDEQACNWLQAEEIVLGFNHTQISRELLGGWSFPESLLQVAAHYAKPSAISGEFRSLVEVVHLAKHMAIQTGIGVGEDAFWLEVDQPVLIHLSEDRANFEDLYATIVDDVRNRLQGSLLTGALAI
jgi:HD-like signal output (HDOD) protein